MGQFGNQPDFATNDIQEITPNDTITNQYFLNGAVIYIGDNTTTGTHMKVIPAGTVGPSVVTALSSPGYAGSGGTGYEDAGSGDFVGGNGTNLQVDWTASNGAVTSVTIINPGTGYLNGDLVTLDEADSNAVFRVVAAPGLPTAAQAVTFKGLQAGGFLPVTVDYVLATGTTVAELIAAK
jgi:hypothetical protein